MLATLKINRVYRELLCERARYKVYYGGRGSGKSWAVAQSLIVRALEGKHRILCTRELQRSIQDSVYRLLIDVIKNNNLQELFDVTKTSIVSRTGSEFIFHGLRLNIAEIKSTEGITICWVEEAQRVSAESWEILIPTIRTEWSEIWITFNPDDGNEWVYKNFVEKSNDRAIVRKTTFRDNPFFPEILKKELDFCKQNDYDSYKHIWEGEIRIISDAVIFKNKYTVDRFDTPGNVDFYYGIDWGFSQDPTVLVRCYVDSECLYIDYCAYGVGVDIDMIGELFDQVPLARQHEIIADSSRPETISYLNQRGWRIKKSIKGSGSVEDGISYLRSFARIIIHERCTHVIDEFGRYRYKTNKLTGQITTIVEDAHNHTIDAIRYAIEPLRRRKNIYIGAI